MYKLLALAFAAIALQGAIATPNPPHSAPACTGQAVQPVSPVVTPCLTQYCLNTKYMNNQTLSQTISKSGFSQRAQLLQALGCADDDDDVCNRYIYGDEATLLSKRPT
ncbi:hypothetical protein P691DRAFT_790191 [Macrolepiota fuliginosa MF-IS2]|uniref:Uncharacterized protein n=1 Tax=Macrolepiota fuliginosa MF-IS2 TaxID=1400762 RepID=A0A9P5X1R6_9AGAR|nr:hypothetical protein P691DRAFT_790191 [Macrolepiota fuliginosa MF-IS2]